MVAKMKCIQTTILALVACLTVVKSLEQYEDQSAQPSSDKVQSKYINMIIQDKQSRQKRQSRAFFSNSNKLNGGSNESPNAIDISSDYSGNADFAFPGESYRPTNYPIEDNESTNNQFGQTRPNADLIQGNSNNNLPNQPGNNVWQGNWLNPNFNYEGRDTNPAWPNQNNNWNVQPANQGWGNGGSSTSQPNLIASASACQWECRRYVTGEYNPICGSDGVTYLNPARFKCAVNCGKQITGKPDKTCGYGSPVA